MSSSRSEEASFAEAAQTIAARSRNPICEDLRQSVDRILLLLFGQYGGGGGESL